MHRVDLHKPLAYPLRETVLIRRYRPFIPIRNSLESPVPLSLLMNGKRVELNKQEEDKPDNVQVFWSKCLFLRLQSVGQKCPWPLMFFFKCYFYNYYDFNPFIFFYYHYKNITSVFPPECHYYISNQNGDDCVDPI